METFSEIMNDFVNYFNVVHGFQVDVISAGSSGEGISKPFASDYDFIFSPRRIICVDQRSDVDGMYVMQNEFSNTEPGYVRLVADVDYEDGEGWYGRLTQILCKHCDFSLNNYLSSSLCARFAAELFTAGNIPQRFIDIQNHQMNGPALTQSLVYSLPFMSYELTVDVDLVVGLQFYSAEVMRKWRNRKRHHQWPSTHLQREIAEMEEYLVPVGLKLSEFQDIEWRISYTTAERKLVQNMQDEQVRLYAALKIIHKDFLKPLCRNFTSYFIKNLLFWVLELTPIWAFTSSQLYDRVISALCHLKRFLKSYMFPNYIIPERNMFLGRMTPVECKKMSNEIQHLIDRGCAFLFSSQKLSVSIQLAYNYPDRAKEYALWLMQIEEVYWPMMLFSTKKFNMNSYLEGASTLDIGWEMLQSAECSQLWFQLLELLFCDGTMVDFLLPDGFNTLFRRLKCVLS